MDSPGNSMDSPGNGMNTPGNSMNTPGNSMNTPGNSMNTPENRMDGKERNADVGGHTGSPRVIKADLLRQQSLAGPEIQNPYHHSIKLSLCDKLRVFIMSLTIAPLRFICLLICLLPSWILASICVVMQPQQQQKPFQGWRKSLLPLMRFLHRLCFFVVGFHVIDVKGRRDPTVTIICVAPHTSFFDTVVATAVDLPSGVSKAENANIPIFGKLIRYTQSILVYRSDPHSRQATVAEIRRRCLTPGWPPIIIFPEGTTTSGSCLISFKAGAFIPGVSVQPVCLRFKNKSNTTVWTWDGPSAFTVFWLTLCQFNNKVEIEFLDVYHPNEEEKKNAKLFARNVRGLMSESLELPVTEHSLTDCKMMMLAAKQDLPSHVGLIEFEKLSTKLGISIEMVEERLDRFSKIAKRHTGLISIQDFAEYLHVPVTDALQSLFSLYDRNGSGLIDFREYVIGMSLLTEPANTESTIQLAFQLFDEDGKGHVSEQDLTQILCNAFQMTREEVKELYDEVDVNKKGTISYDEFYSYALKKPEYAPLFNIYRALRVATGPKPTTKVTVSAPHLPPAHQAEVEVLRHRRNNTSLQKI